MCPVGCLFIIPLIPLCQRNGERELGLCPAVAYEPLAINYGTQPRVPPLNAVVS
ncbi:MAG: hypothetical protein N6V49_01555 [Serratia symbiotica]|nr:hypothetical protein [Serratia symbiotica]